MTLVYINKKDTPTVPQDGWEIWEGGKGKAPAPKIVFEDPAVSVYVEHCSLNFCLSLSFSQLSKFTEAIIFSSVLNHCWRLYRHFLLLLSCVRCVAVKTISDFRVCKSTHEGRFKGKWDLVLTTMCKSFHKQARAPLSAPRPAPQVAARQ
jgi:hypothetical protein